MTERFGRVVEILLVSLNVLLPTALRRWVEVDWEARRGIGEEEGRLWEVGRGGTQLPCRGGRDRLVEDSLAGSVVRSDEAGY